MEDSHDSIPPHYRILGVSPSISAADLARHYKRLSLQLHPDRAAYRNDPEHEVEVQRRYQSITEAYEVLSDAERRAAYDTRHGVNFRSRVSALQAAIERHNDMAASGRTRAPQRVEGVAEKDDTMTSASSPPSPAGVVTALSGSKHSRGSSSASHTSNHTFRCTSKSGNGRADGKAEEEGEAEESDEEYEPAQASPSTAGGGRNRGFPEAEEGSEKGERSSPTTSASRVARMFALQPRHHRRGGRGCGNLTDALPLVQQWRGVTLRRSRESDSFGLSLRGNKLLASSLDTTVPVPSIVTQLCDRSVRASDDVAQIIARLRPAPSRPSPPPSQDEADTDDDSAETMLSFTVTYAVQEYDLIGNTTLLQQEEVLAALVPPTLSAAQFPGLLPGVSVVSVNGEGVSSAEELRDALRALATTGSSTEAGPEFVDGQRPRRPLQGIVVECVCLSGLEQETAEEEEEGEG